MPGLKEAVEEAARKVPEMHKQRILDAVKETQGDHFERASAYVNIIIAGGYAGAFAVWSLVGDVLSKTQRAWVGMLLLASILVFVMWEVTKMILLAFEAQQFVRLTATEPLKIEKTLKDQQAAALRLQHRLNLGWPASYCRPRSVPL